VIASNNDNEDSGAEDEDEETQPSSFGERLRAGRDHEEDEEEDNGQRMHLEEQDGMSLIFIIAPHLIQHC